MITYVIPTLFEREDSLKRTLLSLSHHPDLIKIIICAQKDNQEKIEELAKRIICEIEFIEDEGCGLAAAIEKSLRCVKTPLWNWIGDDDYIETSTLVNFLNRFRFETNMTDTVVIGRCIYRSKRGIELARTKKSFGTVFLLKFGPNLIPQPSCIFPTTHSKQVGFDHKKKFAFDQKFIHRLNLRKNLKFIFVNEFLANYTWSEGTLTSQNRWKSIIEANKVRMEMSNSFFEKILICVFAAPTALIVISANLFFKYKSRLVD